MLETLQHFAFEAILAAIGLALIGAGLALLIAQDAAIEGLPLVGRWVLSIRHSAAAVLIGAGCAVLGFVGGYVYRGTLDQSAALRNQVATEQALRDFAETRTEQFAKARRQADARADTLAAALRTLAEQQRKDDEAARAHDIDACLAADSVQRLNAIGRPRDRR